MSNSVKTLVFAAALCLVCSILLTAAATGLKGFQQKNIAVDKQKNILKSVGLIDPQQKYSAEAIEKLYGENIRSFWVDSAGRILNATERSKKDLPIYLYLKENQIETYIVPINSRGLWGRILGYLAIKNDGTTVSGFTVYKHSETPGLGGEIEQNWFQNNFVGKKTIDRQGNFVSIHIAKGTVRDIISEEKRLNYVDGISGATLTGKFLSEGLKDILLDYEPVSLRFRKNQIGELKD